MSAPANPLAGATPVELAIAKLELRAGDVLAIQVAGHVSAVVVDRMREQLTKILPGGVKAMVIDSDTSLSVVRREDIT